MRFIKPFLYYFLFIFCLFLSKRNLDPAKEIWEFLFNNYDETNLVLFTIINIFYLGWLILYFPSRILIFKILNIILKEIKLDKVLYPIILYLHHFYHYIFKLYRKLTINILFYFMSNIKIYNKITGIQYFIKTFDFELPYYFPYKFENKTEGLFYFLFLKKSYSIPVQVEINNKQYIFTLGEVLSLLMKQRSYIRRFSQMRHSKKFRHLIKFINFTDASFDCYLDIGSFSWNYYRRKMRKTSNIQLIPVFLDYHAVYKNYKQAKLFLTLFKCNQKLIRDFFCLNMFKLYNQLQRKNLFLKINQLNFPNQYKRDYYKSYEYSLYYLDLLLYNYHLKFRQLVNFNLIHETKAVYSIIKYSLFYKILSFFILSEILKIILIIFLIYSVIKNWIYLKNHRGTPDMFYYKYKLFNHKVIRIIFYNLAYFSNLFFFNFNFFYFCLLNYLVITFILIIFMSFYDFPKFFKARRGNYTIFSLSRFLLKYIINENLRFNYVKQQLAKATITSKQTIQNLLRK